jgi:hypothetical protein
LCDKNFHWLPGTAFRARHPGCLSSVGKQPGFAHEEPFMSPSSQVEARRALEIPQDIVDLVAAVASLPSEHRLRIEGLCGRVVESTRRRRRILNLVQEALGQLRLDMKYLVFDLEATRRERDAYRAQLEGE